MLNKYKKYIHIVLILTAFCVFIELSEASIQNFELKGTIFTNSLKPIAIIKDVKTGRVSMYEVGEVIGNAKIIDVKRGEVILQEENAKYVLALPGGGVIQPDIDIDINKVNNVFRLSRAGVNKAILKAPQLMQQVKIMPHFAKGRPEGIALSNVKQGSVFEKAGVKSGDVVKSVNGMTLNTPYQIFNAYKKLKGERNFKVDVLRDNKPVILSYIIE